MAVLVEGFSVLVAHSALEQRFPGGTTAYQQSAPNSTYRSDGKIAAISFMVIEDAKGYTTALTKYGFSDPWKSASKEVAVVDPSEGFLTQCDWLTLELRTIPDEEGRSFPVTLARLPGEEPVTSFSAPAGWRPRSGPEKVTQEDLEQNYEVVGVEERAEHGRNGAVVAYRHRQTGRMLYIGRPALPHVGDVGSRYVALRDELFAAQEQHLSTARELRLAALYEQATALVNDTNQQEPGPLLLKGIAARLTRRRNEAVESFRKVTELVPQLLDGWLELTWALALLDRFEEAETAARQAAKLAPPSAAAYGNLATVLLQRGNPIEALAAITRAVELDPSDAKNQRILHQVRDAQRAAPAESESRPESTAPGGGSPWYKRWFR